MAWNQLCRVIAALSGMVLLIGALFALLGVPLVLPFAGIEAVGLVVALYLSALHGAVRQVIRIGDREVRIETGRSAPALTESFRRPWVQVVLERVHDGWYPSRLLLRCHGRQVEVGGFLEEQERRRLAQLLRRVLNANVVETRIHSKTTSADRCRGLEHEA